MVKWFVRALTIAALTGALVVFVLLLRSESRTSSPTVRSCVGIGCVNDRDCGSRCRCDIPTGGQVGVCVALDKPIVR